MPTTHRRVILNAPVEVDLPDELGGRQPVRFTTESLIDLELDLDDLLDRLNARLERAGDDPYESVWEALEELTIRYPMASVGKILTAALPALKGRPIPVEVLNDPTIVEPLTEALNIAFGTDPAEADLPEKEEDAGTDPTAGPSVDDE